jgi:hypothetical protein
MHFVAAAIAASLSLLIRLLGVPTDTSDQKGAVTTESRELRSGEGTVE